MPVVHFDSSDKFPAYDIVPGDAAGGVPALLSDEELDFFHDARIREDYIDALIEHRTVPDDITPLRLDRLASQLREAGIAVPEIPTAAEFEANAPAPVPADVELSQ